MKLGQRISEHFEARPKDFKAFWSRPGFILLVLFVYFHLFLFIFIYFVDFYWFLLISSISHDVAPRNVQKPEKSENWNPIKSGPKIFFPSKDAASVRKLKFQYLVGGGTKNIYRSGWFFSAFQPVLRAKSGKMYSKECVNIKLHFPSGGFFYVITVHHFLRHFCPEVFFML